MEILRVTRDVYGQQVLEGVSWDLLPWFVGAGAALIVGHAAWRWLAPPRRR